MYLIDTNVISEFRKRTRADIGVTGFFQRTASARQPVYISAVSIGELRRGVEIVRRRGDSTHADLLEEWLTVILGRFAGNILPLDVKSANIWGRLRVPDPDDAIDKQIAAIALVNNLTVVTRNTRDFLKTGAKVLNPFSADPTNA
jgi:hypothetical protein